MYKIGIKEFDDAIGGFFGDDIVLIYGPSGTGKTIISYISSITNMRLGHKILYILSDNSKSVFWKSIKFLNFPLEKYLDKNFMIIEFPSSELEQLVDFSFIEQFIQDYDIDMIVLDSIDSLINYYPDKLQKFFENLRNVGKFVILVSEFENIYKYCDVVIKLNYHEIKDRKKKIFEVLKARGRNHTTIKLIFDIYEDGIMIRTLQ